MAEKSNDGVAKVIYTSKDRKTRKVFKFLTFRLCPGLACKVGTIMPNEMSSSEARQNPNDRKLDLSTVYEVKIYLYIIKK